MGTAIPAEAASNTWLNARTSSNTIYTEPANSWSLTRTGVESRLKNADGDTFQTTLWLGTLSTQGSTTANLSSLPGKLRSQFRWRYLPSGNQIAYNDATVTITGVPSGPMGRSVPASGSSVTLPPTVDLNSIGDGTIDPATVAQVGVSGGTVFYSAESETSIYLIASFGETTASTATSKSSAKVHGLTLRLDTESESAQGVLAPSAVDEGALVAAGLVKAGDGFYVDSRVAQRTDTSTGVGATSAKAARSALPAGIVLYGEPAQ